MNSLIQESLGNISLEAKSAIACTKVAVKFAEAVQDGSINTHAVGNLSVMHAIEVHKIDPSINPFAAIEKAYY